MMRRCILSVLIVCGLASFWAGAARAQHKRGLAREGVQVPDMTCQEAIEAIQSDDRQRQYVGAIALCEMGDKAAAAVKPIVKILNDQGLEHRGELLFVLIELKQRAKPAAPLMIEGLGSEDFHTRYLCCRVLGYLGEAARPAVARLIQLVKQPMPSVQRRAAEALGHLGPEVAPEAVEPLMQAAEDRLHLVRVAAIEALGRFGTAAKPALPMLKKRARNARSPECTQAAMAVLALTGDEAFALDALEAALHGGVSEGEAAQMLEKMAKKNPKAISILIKALDSPSLWVRMFSAESLGHLGALGAPALDRLQQLVEDPQAEMRETARKAIEQIKAAQQSL